MKYLIVILLACFLFSCENENDPLKEPPITPSLYFPPIHSDEWEHASPTELNWNTSELEQLLNYLESNKTRAFIVLKDGRIVIEAYFGNNLIGTSDFDRNSQWYWASAGKTITATLVGIAQQEGFLTIENPTSDYLGVGWTSLSATQEQFITVTHQLTMTTGLEYNVSDQNCTLPSCLAYKTAPGQQWFYHNAPYTLLEKVIEHSTKTDYNDYSDQKIESIIGMKGQWVSQGYNNVYWSTARDMARFGLFILNKGKWEETSIISDENYFNHMVNTSQTLNPSYGYLWWLNGKESIVYPGFPTSFNVPLSENAPIDLIAGMGKNGQFVEVVPSLNLVVIRMGEAPDASLVPIAFHNEMWEKINVVMNE